MNDQHREAAQLLIADVINRIADDPGFKQGLLSDAATTLESAGYSERVRQLLDAMTEDAEVAGYQLAPERSESVRVSMGCPVATRDHPITGFAVLGAMVTTSTHQDVQTTTLY